MNAFTINIAIKAIENLKPPADIAQLTSLMHNIAASELPFDEKQLHARKIIDALTAEPVSSHVSEQVFKLIGAMKGYI